MVLHWMPDSGGVSGRHAEVGEGQLTKPLLPQGDLLQFLETVLLGSAVDDSVLKHVTVDGMVVDGRLDGAAAVVGGGLEFP
jgi:hypothetical protein